MNLRWKEINYMIDFIVILVYIEYGIIRKVIILKVKR